MERVVLPQLRQARVSRLTLTGGEPFAHPNLLGIIEDARALDMTVTVCTNATLIEPEALDSLAALGGVRLNVSLDGFSSASHGKFRGAPGSFQVTKDTMRAIGDRGLLKGVLVTPNNLAEVCHERRRRIGCRRSDQLMRCCIGDGGAGLLGWWSSVVAL